MKAYTIIQGRPIGRNPKIYLYEPLETQQEEDNPWFPTIEEWDSVEAAFVAVFNFCPDRDYRDEIEIISEPEVLCKS